jgi:hypothetical protein
MTSGLPSLVEAKNRQEIGPGRDFLTISALWRVLALNRAVLGNG